MNLGGAEPIIILVIALLLFGVGRITRIGGELGGAIREFRKGLNAGDEKPKAEEVNPANANVNQN